MFLERIQHELAGATMLDLGDPVAHLDLTITLDQPEPLHAGAITATTEKLEAEVIHARTFSGRLFASHADSTVSSCP